MKTFWAIVLGLFLLVGCNGGSDSTLGNWVKRNPFEGAPRGQAVSFVIDNKAYVGLGYNSNFEEGNADISGEGYKKDFWAYDVSKDTWSRIARFPGVGRVNAVAFSVNKKGYVATGYDGNNRLKDVWEYDPLTDKWTQKDDFPEARRYAVGFGLKGAGYVGTGTTNDGSDRNDFYKFDPNAVAGSQWVKVATIGDKCYGATAFVYNDAKAYICTGSSSGYGKVVNLQEYDPTANTWTKKVSLTYDSDWTITRDNACSFVMDNKAYVCLGSNGSSTLKTCWEYDFSKDTWVQKSDFEGMGREYAVGFRIGERAFIATGQSGSSAYFDDVWEFKPYEESNTND